MKMIKIVRSALLAAFTMLVGLAFADSPVETTEEAVTGKWIGTFATAKGLSEETLTPMVLVWAAKGCDHCALLENAINSAQFKSWMASHDEYVYCFVYNKDRQAQQFARSAAGTWPARVNWLNDFPYVCLYWPKDGGEVSATSFTGRTGRMLEKQGSLAVQFEKSIETFFAEYSPTPAYAGGDLAFASDAPGARLEAEVGFTEWVEIPLVRPASASRAWGTNVVVAALGRETLSSTRVVWAPGDTEKSVRISVPATAAAGDTVDVSLRDAEGAERGNVGVHVVSPVGNSPRNPLFIGERTKDTLQFGEWTMDLDVALEKYAADPESRLLAMVAGSMWCPDCVMTDHWFVDREEFKAWAKSKRVILVDVDIPNLPNTTTSPSLLTRIVSQASAGYRSGRGTITDPAEQPEANQSGAGYLSRHMVTAAEASAVIARNALLVGTTWDAGGWNDPDRSNQSRTGVPVFMALTRGGEAAGCFDRFSSSAPAGTEHIAAYLARLDELTSSASRADLLNRSWRSTGTSFAGEGAPVAGTLSAVDLVDVYRLAAVGKAAVMQSVTVGGTDAGATVSVSLVSVIDGVEKMIATATGKLADGISVEGVISSAGAYYVRIAGDASGTLSAESTNADTEVPYSVSGVRSDIVNPFTNDWITKSVTANLPLYSADGSTLVATLGLTQNARMMVTARLYDGKSSAATLSGRWDKTKIAADGTISLDVSRAFRGVTYSLGLTLYADGVIEATLSDGSTTLYSGECGLAESYADFAGTYLVALPSEDDGAFSFMTLTMAPNRTAANSGRFSYVVRLSDGTNVSGTSNVTGYDANFGIVPIVRKVNTTSLSGVLKIRRNAASAPSRRAVVVLDGTDIVWESTKRGSEFTRRLGAYGSFYDKTASLLDMADISGSSGVLMVAADASGVPDSATFGHLSDVMIDGAQLNVTAQTMALPTRSNVMAFSFNRSTGMFTGRTQMAYEGYRGRVYATFTGVVLPGWFSDCGCSEDADTLIPRESKPFGVGFCTFTDREGRTSVKRSFPIAITGYSAE